MLRPVIVSLLFSPSLLACAAPQDTAKVPTDTAAERSDNQAAEAVLNEGQTKAVLKTAEATGYFMPGMQVPANLGLTSDDVARDSYGRPWDYAYLGQTIPAFSGTNITGDVFESIALSGRWTVIEVWGIWCHDSMRDAKYAAALSTALDQDPDVDFLTIHTPQNADRADKATKSYPSVAAWFDEKGYQYSTLVDNDATLRDTLRIRWTPTYLVVAPDLSVQGFRTGLADAGDMAVKDFVRDIAMTRAIWQAASTQ